MNAIHTWLCDLAVSSWHCWEQVLQKSLVTCLSRTRRKRIWLGLGQKDWTNGEGMRTMCLKDSSSDFPTCHSVSHSQNPEKSVSMSNSNGKNTNSVVHGDSSALGLNVNVGCVQVRGLGEFPWENKERRLRNYYVYTCIKGYFVVRVRKSVKHIQILTLFKTENIGIPNQTKKKQKERKQAPVIHKFQVYEYLWLHILSMNPYYMSTHPKNTY